MKIIFTGDFFPGGDINLNLEKHIYFDEFFDADLRVVNLESPITDFDQTTDKSTLFCPIKNISVLINNQIDIVSLANNHIHDKTKKGLFDTLNILEKSKIKHIGVGNLEESSKALKLTDNLYLISFCEKNNSYLKKVEISDENTIGVNELTIENIKFCLSKIPEASKAILYMHWGREHVNLPPYKIIKICRQLLKDDKVEAIIGSHPHIIQGIIKSNKKIAYLSLGNFLFPNFYYGPRRKLYYSSDYSDVRFTTLSYHRVFCNTHKKWSSKCRTSLVVEFNTLTKSFKHIVVKQGASNVIIKKASKLETIIYNNKLNILSVVYTLPPPFYKLLCFLEKVIRDLLKKAYILMKLIPQFFFIKFFVKSL